MHLRTLVCALLVAYASLVATRCEAAPQWGHGRIVQRDGDSVFEVDGKPFFMYGAAFFYERLPRDMWADSMTQLKSLGINTLDLYVPWNWHELADGDFDFTGRTSPRRDLDEVLRLAAEMHFEIVLRPGPVVRNEWRNGGYPAWLLSRPEYGMPLHDLLEGRYPPTATLQNQHSDDAAAQWMANTTHVTYAKRWLERVLHETQPYADRIIAVALDDDQGAYIDNQTYPAPHFQAYIGWLRDVVHGVTGNDELTFINTYQMKVPATSPVWAMGNWYQSDAYSIGEHDRAQLEFSTSMLHTRPGQPMFASEFQAGWLEQADDDRPRAADPSNTILAQATMLGLGVRGIVNFPAQDTLDPPGWEAPWTNVFYAWDAALQAGNGYGDGRVRQTAAFGALVSAFGSELASAKPQYDAAIVYLGGSVLPQLATNDAFGAIAAATIDAQKACRDASLTCTLVDPSAAPAADLARYRTLVVPELADESMLDPALRGELAAYATAGGRIVTKEALAQSVHPVVSGIRNASFLRATTDALDGFLVITNYDQAPENVDGGRIDLGGGRVTAIPHLTVAAHDALVVPVGIRLKAYVPALAASDRLALWTCMPLGIRAANGRFDADFKLDDLQHGRSLTSSGSDCGYYLSAAGGPAKFVENAYDGFEISALDAKPALSHYRFDSAFAIRRYYTQYLRYDAPFPISSPLPVESGHVVAYPDDVYRDGSNLDVLDNGVVRLLISPHAGGRVFAFDDERDHDQNVFTTVGALRDDVAIEPPLSTVDKIAKYTHSLPAGTFNRAYDDSLGSDERGGFVDLTYTAPDVLPAGARFEKRISLAANARSFDVDENVDFAGIGPGDPQRAVSVTSLSVGLSKFHLASKRLLLPDVRPAAAGTTATVAAGNAFGFYDTDDRQLATIAWRAGDVSDASVTMQADSALIRLTLARGRTAHVRYGYETPDGIDAARRALSDADAAAQVSPSPARTP